MKALRLGVGAVAAALLLVGCSADPPPPVQSTDTPQTTVSPSTAVNQVVVAIDAIGPGFNPHLLADQSPVATAVSSMVLPSAFRPVVNQNAVAASDWVLDSNLLLSADVTSEAPYTVVYTIRPEAQWTDGAPIAAEDFRYLWQQMTTSPGVVDPAGYDLITDVASNAGGKQVTVTFNSPYPAWRELFADLLPSHSMKDIPGGFVSGLTDSVPVSGAYFRIKNVDRERDEILLARNDRFWGKPAVPAEVLMRRAGTPAALTDSIRTADTQVANVHGGNATFAQLSAIPDVRTSRILGPRTLSLTLNGKVGALTDPQARRGILGLLDPGLLAAVGAGSDGSVSLDRAQVLTPSDPGYGPTAPPPMTRDDAQGSLAAAGFLHEDQPTVPTSNAPEKETRGKVVKNGQQLSLVIGAANNDDISVAVANTAADQLRSAGVNASVSSLPPDVLYSTALANNQVDAIVGWQRAGGDPATTLASRYGCPATPPQPSTSAPATSSSATPSSVPSSSVPSSASPSTSTSVGNGKPRPDSNLSGVCDPTLQPQLDAALRGQTDFKALLADAEPKLWQLGTVLPILQDTTVVAAGPRVSGVALAGAVPVGIFADAAQWSLIGK